MGDMLLLIAEKHCDKTILALILMLTLAFSWSCKGPVGPPENTADVTYMGKTYHVVKIGSQYWLKENLDVGTMVDSIQDQKDNHVIEKYCYHNDTANCSRYGGLYQWNEAMQYDTTPGTQGICPSGWHIPTLAEFQTDSAAVSGDGNALKAIGQGIDGGAGTDASGFSGLLGGFRNNYVNFLYLGQGMLAWSSTEPTATTAYRLYLSYINRYIDLSGNIKERGLSVRCIKD
jgi:uncharacterized protein (TIGR02145 family)